MPIKTVTPEAVNVGQTKTGNTKGRDWTLWPVGIKIKDQWYNGALFNQEDVNRIQKDQPIDLEFYEDEYKGQKQWKFKMPQVKLDDRVRALEERVKKLEDNTYVKEKPLGGPQDNPNPAFQSGSDDPSDDLPF